MDVARHEGTGKDLIVLEDGDIALHDRRELAARLTQRRDVPGEDIANAEEVEHGVALDVRRLRLVARQPVVERGHEGVDEGCVPLDVEAVQDADILDPEGSGGIRVELLVEPEHPCASGVGGEPAGKRLQPWRRAVGVRPGRIGTRGEQHEELEGHEPDGNGGREAPEARHPGARDAGERNPARGREGNCVDEVLTPG